MFVKSKLLNFSLSLMKNNKMLYTLLGIVIGSLSTYVVCEVVKPYFGEDLGSTEITATIAFGGYIGGHIGYEMES